MSENAAESVTSREPSRLDATLPSDATLAELVSREFECVQAFRQLYDRHGRDILAMLMARFPPDVVDDAAQGAWLKAFAFLRQGRSKATNFRGWLWTIARHLAIDELRRKRLLDLEMALERGDGHDSALEGMIHRERKEAVRACLDMLRAAKPDYAAVVDAFLDGEVVVEAAKRLGISRDNYDKRKERALSALKVCVEGKLA